MKKKQQKKQVVVGAVSDVKLQDVIELAAKGAKILKDLLKKDEKKKK